MKKLLLLLSLIIAFTTISFSQTAVEDGHVINLNGDTLRGTIKFNYKNDIQLFSTVQIQINANDKKTYKPNQIKEFSIDDDDVFKSKKIENELVFVRVLCSGAINLYEYKTEHYLFNKIHTYVDYYLENPGDYTLTHIKQIKFRKQLIKAMSDNEFLVEGFKNKKYEFKNLVYIFELYNIDKETN